jgi:class 3 adenylate cyclase
MSTEKKMVDKVLSLLREWGWEAGLEKLKAEIQATADDGQRSALKFFAAWIAGERGAHQEALEQLRDVEQLPALLGWAQAGQAYVALRQHDYRRAHLLLDQAAAQGDSGDPFLEATIAHCRGALSYHEGRDTLALSELHHALSLFGRRHFATGRVLDTLGMVYTSKDNFHAAREFFERSIECKLAYEDSAGLAVSHGQLGRLYLEWGHLRKAEEHFKQDLELARRIDDERGEAQMYNYLGRVAIIKRKWEDAAAWLDESIRLGEQGGWRVLEGFARKDRSIAALGQGQFAEAEAEVQKAEDLFKAAAFAEGLAHVNRTRAMIWRAQERFDEAERALRAALAHFETHNERAEVAYTPLEKARVLRARGVPRPLVTDALCGALERAEWCRRDALVREIEAELKEVDEVTYYRRIYERSRGRDVPAETVSLLSGEREAATVLFLDVQGSTEYARTSDPEVIMMTLNQMLAGFELALDRYRASVTAYLGDGFMALLRGADHAKRGVMAALEMIGALRAFNTPREVLGLRPLSVRIGMSSGEVFIGNVGTYHKMDFTAIGTTANLAARLQSEAEPGLPCISRATYEQVQDNFIFKSAAPRAVSLKGLGQQEAWDVIELKPQT